MSSLLWCFWIWHISFAGAGIPASAGDNYSLPNKHTKRAAQAQMALPDSAAGQSPQTVHQPFIPSSERPQTWQNHQQTIFQRQSDINDLRADIERSELNAKAREAEFNRQVENERLRASAKQVQAKANKQQLTQQAHINVLNRSIEQQTAQAGVLIGGVLILLGFVGMLVRQNRLVARQKKQIESLNTGLEGKVRERTAELEAVNAQLRAKNREIEEALLRGQTIERKRVAADLHDNLGGLLSAIKMSLAFLKPQHLSDQEQQIYRNLLDMTKEAYAEIRYLSHNLQPDELEKQGLSEALIRLTDKLNITQSIDFTLTLGYLPRLDKTIEFNLYSICVELCNNILKHSNATRAELRFQRFGDELNMIVTDNGRGLNASNSAGMGLQNIKSRTEAMRGRVEIHADAESGTTFFFILPLSANFAAA